MARTLVEPYLVLDSVIRNFNCETFSANNNCYTCAMRVIKELIPESRLPNLTDADAIKYSKEGFLKESSSRLRDSFYYRVSKDTRNKSCDLGIMRDSSGTLCFAVCIDDNVWASKSDSGFILLSNKSKVRSYRCQVQ